MYGCGFFLLNKYFRFMKKSFVWIYIYIGKYLNFDWLRVFYYDRKLELDIILKLYYYWSKVFDNKRNKFRYN